MHKYSDGFVYLKSKFPKVSDAKLKEEIKKNHKSIH